MYKNKYIYNKFLQNQQPSQNERKTQKLKNLE
jgi:hypothetical protein